MKGVVSNKRGSANVQHKASMFRRQVKDSHEAQAERAARAFVRGETGLRQHLTPAAASGFRLPSSSGETLPEPLRTSLQDAFGAELGALRVHRDNAAGAAAANFGARAFAGGADIYFGEGCFDPFSRNGRELIAHEVAHVLQQTGRASAGGKFAATSFKGVGNIQCDQIGLMDSEIDAPGFLDTVKALHLAGATEDLTAFIRARFRDIPEGARFSEVPASVDEVLIRHTQRARQSNLAGTGEAREPATPGRPGRHTHSVRAQGVLLDLLKGIGAGAGPGSRRNEMFREALELLRSERRIRSAFIGRDFFVYIGNSAPLGELLDAVHAQSSTASLWPDGFIGEIRRFLFTPTRSVRPTPGLAVAWSRFEQGSRARLALGDNELTFAGLWHLRSLDSWRVEEFQRMEQRARHAFPDESPLTRRLRVAEQVRLWGQNIATHPRGTLTIEAARYIGGQIDQVAHQAVDIWASAIRRLDAFTRRFDNIEVGSLFRTVGTSSRFLLQNPDDTLTGDPQVVQLQQELEREMAVFFDLTADNELPGPARMVGKRQHLRTVLRQQSDALSESLMRQVAAGAEDTLHIEGLAWLVAWLSAFLRWLDRAVPGGDAGLTPIDGRRALRIRVAEGLGEFAVFMGWALLAEETRSVLQAGEFDLTDGIASNLALVSNWELDANRSLEDMADDFESSFDINAAPIIAETPITLNNLIHFYQARYLQQLRATLQGFLQDTEILSRESSQRQRPRTLLTRALDAAHAVQRPQRYQVRDFTYAINPSERENLENLSLRLIMQHPKSIRFFGLTPAGVDEPVSQTRDNRIVDPHWGSVIFPKARFDAVFAWAIVDLRPLVLALRPVAQFLGIAVPADASVVEADREWLRVLAGMPEARENVDTLFQEDIERQREGDPNMGMPDLVTLLRRTATLERRITSQRLKALLDRYASRRQPLDGPEQVLRRVDLFSQQILPADEAGGSETVAGPRDDRGPQLAALLLSIAPELRSALGYQPRLDRTIAWYGYAVLAIAAAEDAARRERMFRVLADGEDRTALTGTESNQGLGAMRELLSAMDRVRQAASRRFGFETVENRELRGVNNAVGIGLGASHAFTIDGNRYEFVRIHRAFIYHPEVGHQGEQAYVPPVLMDGAGREMDRDSELPLLTVMRNTVEITLTNHGRWDFLLNELSYVVEMRGRVMQLEQLAEDIQAFEELLIEGIELIPGAGQAVMAARIVAGVLQMVASGEFDDIRSFLRSGLTARIRDLGDFLTERLLRPDTIFHFLVGGQSSILERLAGNPTETSRSRRATSRATGRLARLFLWIRGLSRRIATGIRRIRDLIRRPIEAFQSFVFNRPLLEFALTIVSQVLVMLSAMRLERYANLSDLREGLENGRSPLRDRLQQALDSLSRVELPGEILPMQLVVSIVADQVLRRLGGLKVRLIVRFLQITGVWDRVTSIIADALVEAGVDPNELWRELVLENVRTQFEEARNDLVDGVYGALDAVGEQVGVSFSRPTPSRPVEIAETPFPGDTVQLDQDPTPETELLATRIGTRPPRPMPELGQGRPLPVSIRRDAESRFGHDFGHVRIHTEAPLASHIGSLNALAATSGSHIVLATGSPVSKGHVLDHELSHVLQQTGARPLGSTYSLSPREGRHGRGVVFDPAREAAADSMAEQAGRSQGPVAVRGLGAQEWYPSLRPSTLQMIFQVLGGRSDVVRTVEDVARLHVGARELSGMAATIWRETTQKIEGLTTSGVPGFLRSSQSMPPANQMSFDLVKNHLTQTHSISPGTTQAEIVGVVRTLAQESTQVAGEGQPERFYQRRFTTLLEGFIGLRTGILIDIRLHRTPTDASAVSSVVVTNVDLSRIGGNSPIWEAVMVASFPNESQEERDRRRLKIRAVLEREGPQPRMWQPRKFALSGSYWARVLEQTRPPRDVDETVLSRNWPTKDSYVAPTGNLDGLRLGVYREHSGSASYARESHHTVQYLLLEYFRNKKTAHQPFRPSAGYPWVRMSGALADRYDGTSGQIEFADLESGRGGSMPALLLSAEAHEQARLHIPAISFSRWDPTKELEGSATQAATVHDEYRGQLRDQLGTLWTDFETAENSGALPAYLSTGQSGQTLEPRVERAMYRAIQNTYRYVYDHMVLGRLLPGLIEWELPYYRRIAAMDSSRIDSSRSRESALRLQPNYELTRTDMERVFTATRNHTKATMEEKGWKIS